MIPPMRWCAPGYERPLGELLRLLGDAAWPELPAGFELLTPARPMRIVMRGSWDGPGPGERVGIVVKWQRADTLTDQVSKRVRGGKGVREGKVLSTLTEGGVAVPEPLAYTDEDADVLVTRALDGLTPLAPADEATRGQLEEVAALVSKAHALGMRHRDIHAGNLALHHGRPVLIDLGGARIEAPADGVRVKALARLVHGLLGGTRRTQRARALRAYVAAGPGMLSARALRDLAQVIEATAQIMRRRYRRGRDRRAGRTGKHFEQFTSALVARGVRFKDTTDEAIRDMASAWLDAPPADAERLKTGGAVLRAGPVVLKYYEPVAAKRRPRPLGAFRRAFALMNRGVAVPEPHVAAARADGSGVYAATWIDAPDLHTFVASQGADENLLLRLGRTLRLMHDAEVTHRDLKAPNLLVAGDGRFPIVDLEGVRIRKGPVSWKRRARDMMRLDASLDLPPEQRRHVLRGYYDVLPGPPISFDAWTARVADLSVRKRGPSGEPR